MPMMIRMRPNFDSLFFLLATFFIFLKSDEALPPLTPVMIFGELKNINSMPATLKHIDIMSKACVFMV